MDLNLSELNLTFDTNGEHLVLEVIDYICGWGSNTCPPKVGSIGLLRDGNSLIKIISSFERQTQWQSSRVIDLFFKYKNDTIGCYDFINGWIDCYYNCGQTIVGDGFRFATNNDVMIIALLVLNVLYIKRDSLTYDLKTRLEALWIDFNSIVDSIVLWMRTRAQLIDSNPGLHSCAQQLFSGQSLFEYQSIQQRLTQMVQQNLINEQQKKLSEKDLIIRKQSKEYSDLGTKMLEILRELNELKKNNTDLASEVKWQMSSNSELNQTIAKLNHENKVLKALALKNSSALKGIMDCANNSGADRSETNAPVVPKCEPINDTVLGNNNKVKDSPIESNINGMTAERNDETDSLTEIEDITDSGNHSDAATDDILLEINQNFSPKQENNENNIKDKIESKDGVFHFNSWQEFFANDINDSNNNHDLNESSDQKVVQNNDTYNISNHSLGTNDNRVFALIQN